MFFGFSFQRNWNRYIFFEPCEAPIPFPFIKFCCEGNFFCGQSLKRLSADRLRCEHRRFYMVTSVKLVLYMYTRRPRTAWRTHKENKFSCAILWAACQNRVMKFRTHIFVCHNLTCKPPQNAHMHKTLGHFQTVSLPASQLMTNWIGICSHISIYMWHVAISIHMNISADCRTTAVTQKYEFRLKTWQRAFSHLSIS